MKKVVFLVCALICSIGVSTAQFKPQPFKWDIKYRGEVSVGGAFSNMMRIPPQPETFNIPFETSLSRPTIETVHGVSLSNYLYVGAGIGLQAYAGDLQEAYEWFYTKEDRTKWGTVAIPLFVNVKGFFPINDNIKPFTSLSFGGTAIACSNLNVEYDDTYNDDGFKIGTQSKSKLKGGFYCDWGVGVEYKRWSFALGLQHQRYTLKETDTYYDWDYDYRKDDYVSVKETETYKLKMYSNSFYLRVGISF